MQRELVFALPRGGVDSVPEDVKLIPVDQGPFMVRRRRHHCSRGSTPRQRRPDAPAPVSPQFPHSAPLSKVHYMFTLFPNSQAVVTRYGRYTGMLMRSEIARRREKQTGMLAEDAAAEREPPRRRRGSSISDLANAHGVLEPLDEEDGRV